MGSRSIVIFIFIPIIISLVIFTGRSEKMSFAANRPREFIVTDRSLPKWCNYTQWGYRYKQSEKYYKYFGPVFHHMHHYCDGIHLMNSGKYLYAVKEFDYVLDRMPQKHKTRPEILMRKGWAQYLAGEKAKAARNFYGAVTLNPKLVSGYIALANIYIDLGDKKEAKEILIKGLKQNPKSKTLKDQLAAIQ